MGHTAGGTWAGRARLVAGVAALAVTATACASGGGSSQAAGEAQDANGVVNMVMAPDPVWKWLEDQGIKQEMEEAAGVQILTSSSWDEFGVYAGGHADVISAASYEVPDLEEATGEPATVFGKYNTDRSIVAVGADNPAQTICDLEGQRIATFTNVSITLIWGMYAKDKCGLDLRAGRLPLPARLRDPRAVDQPDQAAVRRPGGRPVLGRELQQRPRRPHPPADQRLRRPRGLGGEEPGGGGVPHRALGPRHPGVAAAP
jgi:hypothetical protein